MAKKEKGAETRPRKREYHTLETVAQRECITLVAQSRNVLTKLVEFTKLKF